ncbi:MAG TPA: LysR family transcriptional regulator [Rhodoglobus sp.]|nr:LysR family transcriptional regulator [Rhodoglobus sp.]HPG74722.1 LysR family transcriptional regulator [Rhodoglobus sp.]HPM52182.1 LysR family transcriptional regulator [Rhodoglobus sp.]
MIDARKLRMVAALDRLGTIAEVARELRLTAPGVSMQLGSLERELGIALTERRGRRLALTPAGKVLAAHGRDIVDRLSLAELEVESLRRGAVGHYRLAAFPSAARTFVADTWALISAESAGLTLTLTTPEPEDALAAVTAGRSDLAVIHSYSNVARTLPEGIEAEPLVSEPVWLAIRADDPAAADVVDLAVLADHTWITPPSTLTCFDMVERSCGLSGFRPRVVAETADFAVQLELVAAGVGVALVPDLTVALLPPGVRLVSPAVEIARRIAAARRSTMLSDPALDTITGLLRERASDRVRTRQPQ